MNAEPTSTSRLFQSRNKNGIQNWYRIVVLFVLGYEAAGALLGGSLLIVAPDGHYMDMPVTLMHGFFHDFLVPGIILFALGTLCAFAFFMVLRSARTDWLMAGLALGGFICWFVVEIIILQELHWLHLMWGLPVLVGSIAVIPLIVLRKHWQPCRRMLLYAGILSSIWYIAINIFVPMLYPGYSTATFTVSELSATNAPTRILWILCVLPYPLLFSALGWELVLFSKRTDLLHSVGYLIVFYCVFNLYWPPMHMRGNEAGLADLLHIVWAIITTFLMWLIMVLGAWTLGSRFRVYTLLSILLHLGFGVLTFLEAPGIAKNEPTPTIGIWERLNIFIFMLWVVVFAVALLRKHRLMDDITAID